MSGEELFKKAIKLRQDIIKMLAEAGSGHPGGSLSALDIMVVLYYCIMNHDPKNPNWEDRDRFILSKGHACPALYVILADCGYFQYNQLFTLRKYGSILQGHPYNVKTPGVELSTGSLGQGLSFGCGVALAAKMNKKKYHTFVLVGDGECDEGQIWEAAMFAVHHKLDNLTVVVDRNRFQLDGPTEEILSLDPLVNKWKGFSWYVLEVNGHDYDKLKKALDKKDTMLNRPKVVIAYTIKGKGVSFMENNNEFHGRAPTKEEAEKAIQELNNHLFRLGGGRFCSKGALNKV